MNENELLESSESEHSTATSGEREALHEHLELAHYIEVFRASSEYVRRIIFIILVFSIVMLVAQWNTTDASWVPRRYDGLKQLYERVKHNPESQADAVIAKHTNGRLASREELLATLEEYRRHRVEKVLLLEIPGLGVTFDINDLGNFCGVAYALLLILLVLALIREHENLYLALFKVRRLHDRDKHKGDGESKANYLYHALAMSQVLSSPPTLAQWSQPFAKRALLNSVLFVPALVQGYIIYVNVVTLFVARAYGSTAKVMLPQYAFFLINVILGILALLYAEACNHRWKSAFLYINPALKYIQSQPWPLWVKRPTSLPKDPLQRHLWAQAISKLTLARELADETITVKHAITLGRPMISYGDVVQMCREIEAEAAQQAHEACESFHVLKGNIVASELNGSVWEVAADFDIRCRVRKTAEGGPTRT